uniref:Methyltransferase-like protein n=1 Tax=Azospirillum brasilense TaxID=192 RepID=Q6QW18_AZOBR|nr:methyltransferase-like protein [Azospirillum brasilense]
MEIPMSASDGERPETPPHVKTLESLARKGCSIGDRFAPGSPEGREAIAYWFEVIQYADRSAQPRLQRLLRPPASQALPLDRPRRLPGGEYPAGRAGPRYRMRGQLLPAMDGADRGGGRRRRHQPGPGAQSIRNNTMPNLRFLTMDATRELPEGRFDVVVCSHVLEHLDDPVPLLTNLARHIPKIVVKVPAVDSTWYKLVRKDIGLFWMDDPDHRREYTLDLLREHLEAGGWTVASLVRGFDLRAIATSPAAG